MSGAGVPVEQGEVVAARPPRPHVTTVGDAYDLWQHLAQPAASVQHLAQVALSLQQLPSQAMAGLAQALSLWQQVEQPVVIRIPAAKTAARIIIDFIFVGLLLWLGFLNTRNTGCGCTQHSTIRRSRNLHQA